MSSVQVACLGEYDVLFDLLTHEATIVRADPVFGWEEKGSRLESSRVLELVHPDSIDRFLAAIERCSELGRDESLELELNFINDDHEGAVYRASVVCKPTQFSQGRPMMVSLRITWRQNPA